MRKKQGTSGNEENDEKKSKRLWRPDEEKILIIALKQVVEEGWRIENGFRAGYHNAIESIFKKWKPESDIRAQPHIHSKVHHWKREYYQLVDFLSKSGTGFNNLTNMLDASDAVWDELQKASPRLYALRYKTWPFYYDWQQIFGKDRATGAASMSFTDALPKKRKVDDHLVEIEGSGGTEGSTAGSDKRTLGIGETTLYLEGNYKSIPNQSYEESTFCGGDTSEGNFNRETECSKDRSKVPEPDSAGTKSGKRPRKFDASIEMVLSHMTELNAKTCAHLEGLSSKLGVARDMEEKQIMATEIIRTMPVNLTSSQRFSIAEAIASNPVRLNYFLRSNDAERESIVMTLVMDMKGEC